MKITTPTILFFKVSRFVVLLKRFSVGSLFEENSKSTTQLGYLLLIRRVPAITTGWMFFVKPCKKMVDIHYQPTQLVSWVHRKSQGPIVSTRFYNLVQDGVKPVGSFTHCGEVSFTLKNWRKPPETRKPFWVKIEGTIGNPWIQKFPKNGHLQAGFWGWQCLRFKKILQFSLVTLIRFYMFLWYLPSQFQVFLRKHFQFEQITVKVLSSHMVGEMLIDEIHPLSTFSQNSGDDTDSELPCKWVRLVLGVDVCWEKRGLQSVASIEWIVDVLPGIMRKVFYILHGIVYFDIL